jgi:hypothetical protein
MWWCVTHDGVIAVYGERTSAPAAHNTGHSTYVVGVERIAMAEYRGCIVAVTASGNRWLLDADVEGTTPGPEWRGLGTMLVQRARKHTLVSGTVFGKGAEMSLAERIAWRVDC